MEKLIKLHEPDWLDMLEKCVSRYEATYSDCYVYGLIDIAFSTACHVALKDRPAIARRSLFDLREKPDERLVEVSPTLIQLASHHAADWRPVMCMTDGWPMVSLIVTPESLDALALRLHSWCEVDADGENYCLRFADTRRLPDIVSAMTPEQHGQFFGPAKMWLYRERRARWTELPLPQACFAPAGEIKFSNEQCSVLIVASELDEIIENLKAEKPELMQGECLASIHRLLCVAIDCAGRYGITETDRASWCVAWLRHPELHTLPRLGYWMEELKENRISYSELLETIELETGKS